MTNAHTNKAVFASVRDWSTAQAGSVIIPDGCDLTAPALEDVTDTEHCESCNRGLIGRVADRL